MTQENIPGDEDTGGSRWSDRHGWIGSMLMAIFAGLAPAPPPKPARVISEYHQEAENPDRTKLDAGFVLRPSDDEYAG